MNLPGKLKAWRESHKLSQSQAANALRIPVRTLQDWEQGRRTPHGLSMVALRDALEKLDPPMAVDSAP